MASRQPESSLFTFLPAEVGDRGGRRLTIRLEERGDFFGLMRMYGQFEPRGSTHGLPPADRQEAARWLRHLQSLTNLVTCFEGRIVGHALMSELAPGRTVELLIYVHQSYRRRGIGTALAQFALRCAQAAGCKLMWALVERDNRPALIVCAKAGFRPADLLEPELEMQLPLDRPAPSPLLAGLT